MFDNIMLDLETLDTRETAVILSIGAVRFSLDELVLGDEFYCIVDPVSCQQHGLTIGADTVRWWMGQSAEARAEYNTPLSEAPYYNLPIALERFQEFVGYRLTIDGERRLRVNDSKVWGNGATFDNMIIRNAYRACNLPVPWSYKNDMCFRTMMKMFPVKEEPSGVKHHALDDARRQAQALIRVWQSIERHNPMDLPAAK